MAKMNVLDFVAQAKRIDALKTKYKLGKFMNTKSDGYYLCDCSGLIKAIMWNILDGGTYKGTSFPDINANTMISTCSAVSTNFDNIVVGALVWLEGHIGIYVGDGKVIESSPAWANGVQTTACLNIKSIAGLKGRRWTKWGKLDKYVDYSSSSISTNDKVKINGVFKADDVQKVYGIYQIKETALSDSGFTWKQNGIPERYVDLTNASGVKRSDSDKVHAKKGDYFKFNTTFKVVKRAKDNNQYYVKLSAGSADLEFWVLESKCTKI